MEIFQIVLLIELFNAKIMFEFENQKEVPKRKASELKVKFGFKATLKNGWFNKFPLLIRWVVSWWLLAGRLGFTLRAESDERQTLY